MTTNQDNAPPIRTDAARPLAAYRVVELPGGVHISAGKAFADLGAEVIKIEPPGGDPARRLPPLAKSADGEECSLYWTAYSLGKRSVTADLDRPEGRQLVRRLLATADVAFESYDPGVLESLGLGYARLRADNPGLVLASITPFGQDGPLADWKGSDLVEFAMGGYLYMTGANQETPIKPSAPYQSWLYGSLHAVSASLLALRRRKRTGEGAYIDEARRDTGPWMLSGTFQYWDLLSINLHRYGSQRDVGGAVRLPNVYRCVDGYVIWLFQSGPRGKDTGRFVEWMHEHGMAPDWLREQDWEEFDLLNVEPEVPVRLAEAFAAFFATKRKAELLDWAIAHGIMLAPVQSLRDVLSDRQLNVRQAWRSLDIETGRPPVVVPGPPIRLGEGDWEPRGAPPALGADNAAVYAGLGYSPDQLAALQQRGIL